jgi:hypothetical protein
MSGDYTRFTFKPRKDFSGVFKQQGRVDLDADWNELVEMVDRRWRSETIDIIGHCTVPDTTPDAFLVIPTGAGTFDIGIGRMYVDGIQVEGHGRPPVEYLADLGEPRGTRPVPYSDQPYLPAPLPPPLPGTPNTTDLVYIDVWQREVTVLEDPSLREIALGGPDTATRVQSVWQVRALANVGDHGCSDDIAAWNRLVAPSAGRLSTSAVSPPASDDPCIISPTGGYRGLENRLYRVEIHAVGPIGGLAPAQFKWSRNNATIASSVTAIPSSTQVTVEQVGRDQVLRFDIGTWIEITDDFREFQGLAGHMAQITAIDEANRVLTFAPAIPGAITFDPTDASRHTRVRRWDQVQNVAANGLLDVVAGPIDIEDGIRVTFTLDPGTGGFKGGDYWVFAARTADGSVELLQAAPPRGILHHFCRLGFIHWGATVATTMFTDCRNHWPPLCCEAGCTVTVGDGVDSHGQFTDIQQAINALGNRGGVVCIARGFYTVGTGLVLDATKRNVIIRGMGPATRIYFNPDPGAASRVFLELRGTEHVRLEGVFVVASDAEALVRINESHFCRVEGCILVNLPKAGQAPAIELVKNCNHCEILDNGLVGAKIVAATDGEVANLQVRENRALATQVAVTLWQARDVHIDHNQFHGLGAQALPMAPVISRDTIGDFQLQVSSAFRAPAVVTNFQAEVENFQEVGIGVYWATGLVVTRNLITAKVATFLLLGINVRVEGNDLLAKFGILAIFGIVVKVEDNFVLGTLAGLMSGILGDLDCTGNEWVAMRGIVWLSLAQLLAEIQGQVPKALSALGFVTGTTTFKHAFPTTVPEVGLLAIAKLHRNVFVSGRTGIYKTDPVMSGDLAIVDNTFLGCMEAGIQLGRGLDYGEELGISWRHLIQSNELTVWGRGIVSATPMTLVEQNHVECPAIAIDLDAPDCTARNNFLLGRSEKPEPTAGLIMLHKGAKGAVIAANELREAPGHSILIQDDIADLTIADNRIRRARHAGIGVRDSVLRVSRARISRNLLEGCRGDVPGGSTEPGGVLVLGTCEDISITDNTFVANSRARSDLSGWFVINIEEVQGLEVNGNTLTDNSAKEGVRGQWFGAIGLKRTRGVVRLQHNVVRDNGGFALYLDGPSPADPTFTASQVLVQNNHFASDPKAGVSVITLLHVASLQFVGNQCLQRPGPPNSTSAVNLLAATANVCANSVEFTGGGAGGLLVAGEQLVVSSNVVRAVRATQFAIDVREQSMSGLPVQVVVTSNVASAILADAAMLVVTSNMVSGGIEATATELVVTSNVASGGIRAKGGTPTVVATSNVASGGIEATATGTTPTELVVTSNVASGGIVATADTPKRANNIPPP